MLFARQPIFNTENKVVAYEFLYRNEVTDDISTDLEKTVDVLTNVNTFFFNYDIDTSKKMFLNFDRSLLLDNIMDVLSPTEHVIEILETVEEEKIIVNRLIQLKRFGFKIAIDDYKVGYKNEEFINLADYIKVDFMANSVEEIIQLSKKEKFKKKILLAEKVENENMHHLALKLNYKLFQGFYYAKPIVHKGNYISINVKSCLEIIKKLNTPKFTQSGERFIDLLKISKYIEKDPALERRFASVMVDEPNKNDTLAILRGIKDKYEAHHWIKITDSAIETAVDLAIKYISDRKLPDKAIDLMDEAMSSVKLNSISKPVEIDKIEKEIRNLKIEFEAKKSEKISESELKNLEEKISQMQKKSEEIEKSWKFEKDILTEIKQNREKIDSLKSKAIFFEREWNLWEVARIRYGEIPELEKNISANEAKMKELEKSGKNFLKNKVDKNDIAAIIAKWTWIPASKLIESEKQKLLNLENILSQEVIWQKEAIDAISNAIRRARAWLSDESKPIWSFLFLWPTWVGKTQTAKALAKALFDDEKNMIRIDMSEYMEKHSVSRLVWAPPWYIWYEEGWQLTEAVRRKPYSVILFDEVEKAHKDVFNILLQVLDDGRLTDGKWRIVNFKNTIIILTSNIWSYKIQEMTNQWKSYDEIFEALQDDLKAHFRPEFLNRLDDVILFHPLWKEIILWIVDNLLAELKNKLKEKNISISFWEKIKDFLINVWYDKDFGARPLKRAITKHILNNISSKIISWEIKEWDTFELDIDDNKNIIVKKGI